MDVLRCKTPSMVRKEIHVYLLAYNLLLLLDGEWKVRTHGVGKRRTWRKLHLGEDVGTGEILAAVVTTNDIADCEVLPDLLEQIDFNIEQVSGDGGYDTNESYDTITQRQAKAVIPPRSNAQIQQPNNSELPPHPRDENLRRIHQIGRPQWKQQSRFEGEIVECVGVGN